MLRKIFGKYYGNTNGILTKYYGNTKEIVQNILCKIPRKHSGNTQEILLKILIKIKLASWSLFRDPEWWARLRKKEVENLVIN